MTSGQQQNIDKLVMKIKSTGQRVDDKEGISLFFRSPCFLCLFSPKSDSHPSTGEFVIQDAGSTEKFVAGLHLMREATHFAVEEELRTKLKEFVEQAYQVTSCYKLLYHLLKCLQDITSQKVRSTGKHYQVSSKLFPIFRPASD